MKVLIICEDPTHDRYIAEGVLRRILDDLGKEAARIFVLPRRKPTGVHALTSADRLRSVVEENPMIDLFVLVIDRDGAASGNAERAARAAALQEKLVATCAIEEIEAWMLAIFAPVLEQSWPAVRATLKVSDSIAIPFLAQRGWSSGPGAGRSRAMRELGKRWSAVQHLCPEIRALKSTSERAIASSGA